MNIGDFKDAQLDGLYLVTDGDINKPAKDNIIAACRNVRPLYFIEKQDLNEFFIKNQPKLDKFKET